MSTWSYLLGGLGVICLWMIGSKSSKGFLLGILVQLLWVVYAFQTEQYGFLASAVVYISVYIRNYWRWKQNE